MGLLKKIKKEVAPEPSAKTLINLPDKAAKPPENLPKPPDKLPSPPKINPDTPKWPQPTSPMLPDKPKASNNVLAKAPNKQSTKTKEPNPQKAGRWPWRWFKKKSPPKIKEPAAPVVVDQTPKKLPHPTVEVGFRKWCRFCNYLFFITLLLFTLFYLVRHSPIGCLKQALCRMLSEEQQADRSTETTPTKKKKKKKCTKHKALKIKDENDSAEMLELESSHQLEKCCKFNTNPPVQICKYKKPPTSPPPSPPPSPCKLTPAQCKIILAEEKKCKKKEALFEYTIEDLDDDDDTADDEIDDDDHCIK